MFKTLIRFFALVLLLNVIRYGVVGPLESVLIFPGLFGAMEASPDYFNTSFTRMDWVTSYGYNFGMWAVATWVFHLLRPVLTGGDVVASLKAFGIMWLMFASVSAIYMNHYSHPHDFYVWNIVDGLLAFGLLGLANGLLYRRVMGDGAATRVGGGAATEGGATGPD